MVQIDTVLAAWINGQELLDLTKASFDSLKQLNGMKLIVVDNASPMGGGYLRSEADTYIRNQENKGYAPAMNQGLKLTNSNYVCFAENDIVVSPNAFDVARNIFKEDDTIGSVHFRMIEYDKELSFGKDVWVVGKERWCTISFAVFRRRALPLGFFDEGYITANYEDWDIIHHLRHALDWKTAYTNLASYRHKDSFTQKQLDQTKRNKEARANREYFKTKWGNYPEYIWEGKYLNQMVAPWRPFP